jgi:hypothetical protein
MKNIHTAIVEIAVPVDNEDQAEEITSTIFRVLTNSGVLIDWQYMKQPTYAGQVDPENYTEGQAFTHRTISEENK